MNELQNNNITILKGKQLKIYEAQISDYICSTHHFKIYEGDLYVRNGCQDIKVDKYEFYNWIYQLAAQNGGNIDVFQLRRHFEGGDASKSKI